MVSYCLLCGVNRSVLTKIRASDILLEKGWPKGWPFFYPDVCSVVLYGNGMTARRAASWGIIMAS